MKVLVVEDEPLVALFVEEALLDAGIRTAMAASADEAIRYLEADRSITHVVTDVDMPGSMDGLRLSHVIRNRWPPVHLIVMSGRHQLAATDLPERAMFLGKPFEAQVLCAALAELRS